MNPIFDIIVIGILALCLYIGWKRGLILTLYRLVSIVVAIFLASRLFPIVAQWLRETPLYSGLKSYIINAMGMEYAVNEQATRVYSDVLANLPLPEVFRSNLAGITPDAYALLNISTIEAHIGSYLAGIAINILSITLVFLIVLFLMRLLAGALDIVGRLPVIRTFNKLGGLAVGLLKGVIIVWVGMTLMSLFFINPARPELLELLEASTVAYWFYANNIILNMLAGAGIGGT